MLWTQRHDGTLHSRNGLISIEQAADGRWVVAEWVLVDTVGAHGHLLPTCKAVLMVRDVSYASRDVARAAAGRVECGVVVNTRVLAEAA